MNLDDRLRKMVMRYLGRPWRADDGISLGQIATVERSLDCRLPRALRAFYLNIGQVDAMCTVHNLIRAPEALAFEESYLLFMDENQSVVSWGIRRDDFDKPDPPTWQRNNTPPTEWFAEEKSVTELLESMFGWYAKLGIFGEK